MQIPDDSESSQDTIIAESRENSSEQPLTFARRCISSCCQWRLLTRQPLEYTKEQLCLAYRFSLTSVTMFHLLRHCTFLIPWTSISQVSPDYATPLVAFAMTDDLNHCRSLVIHTF